MPIASEILLLLILHLLKLGLKVRLAVTVIKLFLGCKIEMLSNYLVF